MHGFTREQIREKLYRELYLHYRNQQKRDGEAAEWEFEAGAIQGLGEMWEFFFDARLDPVPEWTELRKIAKGKRWRR